MRKVQIEYEWWLAVLEIDDSESTLSTMRDQLLFWTNGQERIKDSNGNIELAYLRMIGRELMLNSMEFNIKGVLEHFKGLEGYAPLDGSHGVKLLSVDSWQFEECDFYIRKIET